VGNARVKGETLTSVNSGEMDFKSGSTNGLLLNLAPRSSFSGGKLSANGSARTGSRDLHLVRRPSGNKTNMRTMMTVFDTRKPCEP
jgi:hypothetical protein